MLRLDQSEESTWALPSMPEARTTWGWDFESAGGVNRTKKSAVSSEKVKLSRPSVSRGVISSRLGVGIGPPRAASSAQANRDSSSIISPVGAGF
jgi:hypothetical protein